MWKMNVGTATVEALTTYHKLDQMQVGGYIAAMVYWIYCFAQEVPERREFTPKMENLLISMAYVTRTTRVAITDAVEAEKSRKKNEKRTKERV
jgi:hypothetical protein